MLLTLTVATVAFLGSQAGKTAQSNPSRQLLNEVSRKIAKAQTISVTLVNLIEEFLKPAKTPWWFRPGGYYRYESAQGTFPTSSSTRSLMTRHFTSFRRAGTSSRTDLGALPRLTRSNLAARDIARRR